MNQDPFIDRLTRGLQKTPPRPAFWLQILMMLGISASAGLILIEICGTRPDLRLVFGQGSYPIEFFVLIALAIAGYGWADGSATPGRIRSFAGPLVILGAMFALVLALMLQHPANGFPAAFWSGSHCFFLITISGLLPMLFTLRLLSRAASTRPQLTTALAFFGSFGAAAAAQHIVCPSADPWHLIIWHLGIFPVSALLAWSLGRRILGW